MNEKKNKRRIYELWLELISSIIMLIMTVFIVCGLFLYIKRIDEQKKSLSENTPAIEMIVNKEI